MLETIPPDARAISVSVRGFPGCSSFTEEDLTSGVHVVTRLGHDLAALLVYITENLSLLSNPSSTITLLGWSLGNYSILSAYHLAATGAFSSAETHALLTTVSAYIAYEPPGDAVAIDPHPTSIAFRTKVAALMASAREMTPVAQMQASCGLFIDYVSAFYDYDPAYTEYPWKVTDSDKKPLNQDEPLKKKYLDGVVDVEVFSTFARLRPRYAEVATGPEAKAIIKRAVQAIVASKVVKVVGVVAQKTAPSCRAGLEEVGRLVRECGGGQKWTLQEPDGPYNHYIHNEAAELTWKAILEGREAGRGISRS